VIRTIFDLCSEGRSICYGIVQPGRHVDGGLPILRVANLRGDRIDTSDVMRVDPEIEKKYKRSRIQENDVLVSLVGSMGQVAIAGKEVEGWNVARAVGIIPATDRHHAEWIRYSLQSREAQQFIADHANTTVQATFNLRDLSRLPIPYPDEGARKDILSILTAVDDKIELNRRMSATLEEMVRALYRSWFVDFDPVHARALGQPPAHMDPTTAALFPDSFGPDGLPKGWEREPLAKHVRATRGLSYKGKHLCGSGEGVPLHNLNSIFEGGGYKDEGAKYYDGDFKPRHEIRPGDLIVANTEQSFGLELIGHAALVPSWFGPSGIFSQHLYKIEIRPGSPLSKEWVYLALSIAPLGVEIRGFSNGTTVNMLPADAFEIPETAIPPAAIVEKMNEIVRPAFAQQERLREEARTLAALRDALLPRLMSGELRIRDAEKRVEELA